VTLARNRYYGGLRAHHVDGFHVDLSAGSPQGVLNRIEAGKADWGYAPSGPFFQRSRELLGKYGLNSGRFQVRPGLTVWMYAFNSSRPLFKDNPELRRAVNLALNRTFFQIRGAETITDQLVPPLVPGFRDHRISPDEGDVGRAKALANGHLRGGKAILYAPASPLKLTIAQNMQLQLDEIGLEVEVRDLPEYVTNAAYRGRLGDPDEPWDLALVVWTPDFVDPYGYVNRLLDPQSVGGTNLTRFDEQRYLDLMQNAARRVGTARARAYADLDLALGSEAAPVVPMGVLNEATLVSARVPKRCMLLRPSLVLTTVCLRR
jgi:ABC-type transport system substrate-binding protein